MCRIEKVEFNGNLSQSNAYRSNHICRMWMDLMFSGVCVTGCPHAAGLLQAPGPAGGADNAGSAGGCQSPQAAPGAARNRAAGALQGAAGLAEGLSLTVCLKQQDLGCLLRTMLPCSALGGPKCSGPSAKPTARVLLPMPQGTQGMVDHSPCGCKAVSCVVIYSLPPMEFSNLEGSCMGFGAHGRALLCANCLQHQHFAHTPEQR